MSIKLNSSGGGSVTLQEPTTASALTLNLPAVNGNVVTTGDSGTITAGMIGYAGALLQVVQTVKSDTSSLASTSFVDVPGMSVTITPSSAANRVMIQFTIHVSYGNVGIIQMLRGSTVVGSAPAANNRMVGIVSSLHNGADNNMIYSFSMTFIDSPATTSATTYKLQYRGETTNPCTINRSVNDFDDARGTRPISTITAMEIKG